MAALWAGADAVYAGGDLFGARAFATNLNQEELLRAIDLAHIHGRKLYLTVNTLLKNRELEETLPFYLEPFVREGLDAVLVQDFGVLKLLREIYPSLPVHASTQMTVTGPEGMRFLEKWGVTRVVPARELTLSELSRMHQESPLEIETFIHGAMCYCYSGMCLLSSLIGGRSGNRGRCAQPCRLPYEALDDQGKKIPAKGSGLLSMKDLNTIDILPEILSAGIASLKIEGRMKRPSYAAGVTQIYRKYLDLWYEKGESSYRVDPADRQRLLALFSRGGSCSGYYNRHNGPEMIAFRDDGKKAEEDSSSSAGYIMKQGLKGKVSLQVGEPVRLALSWQRGPSGSGQQGSLEIDGPVVLPAQKQPLTKEDVTRQLGKLGDTPFSWEELQVDMPQGCFLPLRSLNEFRREMVPRIEKAMCAPFIRTPLSAGAGFSVQSHPSQEQKSVRPSPKPLPIYVSCEREEQAKLALAHPDVTGLYLPGKLVKVFLEEGKQKKKEIYWALPYVLRDEDTIALKTAWSEGLAGGLRGFLVRSLESLALMKSLGWAGKCVLDHTMYAWNDRAVSFFREQGVVRMSLPLELNEGELRHRDNRDSEMLVYGYLPVMISAQCVRKDTLGCDRRNQWMSMTDRKGKAFSVQCCCNEAQVNGKNCCYNVIYNSLPLGLASERDRISRLGLASVRLAFTREEPARVEKILDEFCSAFIRGREEETSSRIYTKGHFNRGT
ncbi:MAG: U32 family peptidase [Blautia sp.]|nr:U32 family peptidase [Blautia sp.]